ncbi:serine/threonine-protein kinase [Pseudarthrobacter equi]|uniref:serine/threonine-protein kinase n=1 Tax=Pseudarthrobacter equi TaxID=728066 RepID=UPI0021BF6135|nr:serine/threonine-protein kinase [Pseudarthrobacter equi]
MIAGRFLLRERLGRGSVAEVFRAVDMAGGPDVAVKVAADNTAKQHQRIRNEARVLASLRHPSIVRYIDQGVMPAGTYRPGHAFLVEELALGTSLSEAVRSDRHSADAVAGWARSMFSALAHLHAAGLVHRDIKPGNLMLSGLRRSPVRVIDFGIAAVAGTAPEPGISSGTVHYMSPEQAAGGVADPSWDVYAMGLVLLELLTGSKAFPGTAVESLVARTLRSPSIPESLGPRWHHFLSSLTAMEGGERPTADIASAMAARLVPSGSGRLNNSARCPAASAGSSRGGVRASAAAVQGAGAVRGHRC